MINENNLQPSAIKICLIMALFFFSCQFAAYTQVRDPELPVVPDIEDKSAGVHVRYAAEINYSGGFITGEIDFNSETFSAGNGGRVYYWKEISSIRILNWVRYAKKKRYTFYPDSYEIVLKSGEKLQVTGNIRQINRFRVIKNRFRRTMYSYYYDDYAGGVWVNTGAADFFSPSLKPAEGCVVSIVFR